MTKEDILIRRAERQDVPLLLDFIRGIARYEKMENEVIASPGSLMWTCFTSDFFIEEADEWREDAWLMIQRRSDLHFFMIADERLPLYRELPIRHKSIICEPLLEAIDFHDALGSWCEQVSVGGESGRDARVCDYDWVLNIREQCIKSNVPFHFKQTGAHFRKDGRLYNIPRNQQMAQANRAGVDIKL